MFHVKSGTARLSQKSPNHIRINWRICLIYSSGFVTSRYFWQWIYKRGTAITAHYASFIEFEVLYRATSKIFFLFTRREVMYLYFLRESEVFYISLLQNKYDSRLAVLLAIMSTASVSNNIPHGESNPTRVECRLACYSVAFHRRPSTLISQFRLASVFHDFIIINLCDFLFFILRAIFHRNCDVSRPRASMGSDERGRGSRWKRTGKAEEKRKLVMYFKRSM